MNRQATHLRILAAAARRPEAPAVIAGDRSLSYRELALRALGVAQRLRALELAPETAIGLCVERTADMAVGTLGILSAGYAFVPLDPEHPRERRLRQALAAGVRAVVAGERTAAAAESLPAARIVRLDELAPAEGATLVAPAEVRPSQLAYVITTSGSTDEPKAVAIEQESLLDLVLSLSADLGFGAEDRHVHTASLAFTLAVRQLLLPLSTGGTVVIAGSGDLRDPIRLLDLCRRHAATVLDTVPSVLSALIRALERFGPTELPGRMVPSLRIALSAGDRLDVHTARAWRALTGVPLVNCYGTSETAGTVFWHRCEDLPEGGGSVPIGRPRSNVSAYVLDEQLQPVAAGSPGDLFIGGRAVGREYLGGPALTERSFLPDPFRSQQRMFRTGDRAQAQPDGSFRLLGRSDDEIKVRGVRIHPGEIESALRKLDGVRDAAVVPLELGAPEPRIVAFVESARALCEAELRAQLRAWLPDEMIPAAFERVERLPRLGSRKIDRRALRGDWAKSRAPEARPTPTAARTATEETLAVLWEAVLGRSPRNSSDSFFGFGGHSLQAAELCARVREALRVDMPLSVVLERPTLAAQAEWLEASLRDPPATPSIERLGRGGRLPIAPAQERMWLGEKMTGIRHHLHRCLRLRGPLDARKLERALRATQERQESLRAILGFDRDGGFQQILDPGWDHAEIDLRAEDPAAQRRAVAQAAAEAKRRPLAGRRGPLWCSRLFRLDAHEHVLLLVAHHAITDGWSMRLWIEEIAWHYAAGGVAPLPPLALQPADVAAWQRRLLAEGHLEPERAYWGAQLRGMARPFRLVGRAATGAAGAAESCAAGVLSRQLDEATMDALRALARAESATPFIVLLAALDRLVQKYTGELDVVIGTLVAGRSRPEVRPLMGLFLNSIPLRVDLAGRPTFRELVRRARRATFDGLRHAELPFERIVADLRPDRLAGQNPLFNLVLNYQPPGIPARLADLELSVYDAPIPVETPFDLMLRCHERETSLRLDLEYRQTRYRADQAAGVLGDFVSLLHDALRDPDRCRMDGVPSSTAQGVCP